MRSWRQGTFHTTERFGSPRPIRWLALSLALVGLVAASLSHGGSAIHHFQRAMSSARGWVDLIAVAADVLLFVFFPAGLATLALVLLRWNVVRVRITPDTIEATLVGGATVRQRWTDLRSIDVPVSWFRLRFADGAVLRVHPAPGATTLVIKSIREAMHPAPTARPVTPGRSTTRALLRIALIFSLVMSVPPVLLIVSRGSAGQAGAGRLLLAAWVYPALCVPLVLGKIWLERWIVRTARRRNRRRSPGITGAKSGDGGRAGRP